jgi:hypothetical protein
VAQSTAFFGDSYEYFRAAEQLPSWPWPDVPERTPGYPLFFLLTGQLRPTRFLVYLQIVLHFLAV